VIGGVYAGLSQIVDPLLAGALAALAGAALTGAFHEDGLGDVADAFAGGWTVERRLEILDDPRLGTFGVLAVTGALVVRASALAAFDGWTALALLPAAHALSRAAAIGLMRRLPPAAPGSLGATYAGSLSARGEITAIGAACALAAALIGIWTVPAVALCALVAAGMGSLSRARIGGLSGDVLGATQQVAELAILVMGAAVVHESWGALAWWAS
jgi:adenosylcobinamide-GDP ribazoletransferase